VVLVNGVAMVLLANSAGSFRVVLVNIILYEQCQDGYCFLWIVSGWKMLAMNNAKNITPPKFPSASMNSMKNMNSIEK
jgi:hypothetical protein